MLLIVIERRNIVFIRFFISDEIFLFLFFGFFLICFFRIYVISLKVWRRKDCVGFFFLNYYKIFFDFVVVDICF